MKKIITSFCVVVMLVFAFGMVSYAAGNFQLTYTKEDGTKSTKTFETFSNIIYQVNNQTAKDGKFNVKLLADTQCGWASGSSTFSKGTVEIDLNKFTLTTNAQYEVSGSNTSLTIKNGNVVHTVSSNYPFLVKKGALVTTSDVSIVSEGNGLSANYSKTSTEGGHLALYNTNITAVGNTLYSYVANSKIEVYGGNFVSTSASGNVFKFQNSNSVAIYGGKFTNTTTTPADFTALNSTMTGNGKIKIYGGTYPVNVPDSYIADGYEVTSNNDGTYTVNKKPTDVTNGATVNYDNGNGEYTYRFFKAIDSYENYASLVFEIKSGEYNWTITLNEVYKKVSVNDETYAAEGYVATGAIGEVPTNDVEFEINAYAVDFEGNKVPLN